MSYEEAEQYEKAYAEKQKTDKMNGYLQDLYMDIDESGIDRKEALEMLDKLSKWCDHRNDIIHGLLDIQTGENFDIDTVKNKSKRFAVRVVNLYKYLTVEKKEYVLSKQILRSGTSIGANIAESEFVNTKFLFFYCIFVLYML